MSEICDIYSMGIKKKLKNYWAAWLPTTRYELGDIGVLNGYYFEKVGSLAALNIPFTIAEDNSPSPIELVSESGVSMAFKLAGEVNTALASVPQGHAGLKIDFGSKGAYVVQCSATYEPGIADPMTLQGKIIDAFGGGRWQSDWAVITRIVTAPTGTILISNSTNAGLELSAEADLTAGLADLGKAELGFSLRSQRGDIIKSMGAQEITPFFQLAMLKRRLFGAPKFVTRSMRGTDESIRSVTPSPMRESLNGLYLDVLQDEEVRPA